MWMISPSLLYGYLTQTEYKVGGKRKVCHNEVQEHLKRDTAGFILSFNSFYFVHSADVNSQRAAGFYNKYFSLQYVSGVSVPAEEQQVVFSHLHSLHGGSTMLSRQDTQHTAHSGTEYCCLTTRPPSQRRTSMKQKLFRIQAGFITLKYFIYYLSWDSTIDSSVHDLKHQCAEIISI